MNRYTVIALLITFLDAVGMGLIMPVLPSLLEEFAAQNTIAMHYGFILALYALMQVIFAPILGQLSDKYGRKPILVISLIGAVCDYTLLSFSSALWMLYLGRMIAGISAATGAVAASMIADNTEAAQRTQWFGRLGAAFGAGLIAGPAIGGFIGQYSAHSPFIAAAILNGVALILVIMLFPHQKIAPIQDSSTDIAEIPLENSSKSTLIPIIKPVIFLLILFFTVQMIGQVPATLWVLFTEARFEWNTFNVGLSLAGLGLMHIFFQAFVAGYIASRYRNEVVFILGFILDATAFALLAFITNVWLLFPTLILLAGGGIALPALQGAISIKTVTQHQGKLQGIMVSLTNLTGVIGPPIFALLYGKTAEFWDGTVWMIGTLLYSTLLLLYFCFHKKI